MNPKINPETPKTPRRVFIKKSTFVGASTLLLSHGLSLGDPLSTSTPTSTSTASGSAVACSPVGNFYFSPREIDILINARTFKARAKYYSSPTIGIDPMTQTVNATVEYWEEVGGVPTAHQSFISYLSLTGTLAVGVFATYPAPHYLEKKIHSYWYSGDYTELFVKLELNTDNSTISPSKTIYGGLIQFWTKKWITTSKEDATEVIDDVPVRLSVVAYHNKASESFSVWRI